MDINTFLEINYNMSQDNSANIYKNNLIYLLNYVKENDKIDLYHGIINKINPRNSKIDYYSINGEASIGSPIIKKDNYKIIGIQTGNNNKTGVFIKDLIQEFYTVNLIKKKEIEENKNTLTIIYKINNPKPIKIFGVEFVENNKKCKIIVKGKEQKICEFLDVYELGYNLKKDKFLEIKLKNLDEITNYFCMFYNCELLYSLPDISKLNTKHVTNMRSMFNNCTSLEKLPDILNWDTSNVIDISFMFSRCSSLAKLPDITKWNTNKVTNMIGIFNECTLLKYLPDISNWNTDNTTNISYLFCFCSSLISLPDISKWKTDKVDDMARIFSFCKNLTVLPDISKWNTNNVINMMNMFEYCSSLTSLPDISKWDTMNTINMMNMFYKCSSLTFFQTYQNGIQIM